MANQQVYLKNELDTDLKLRDSSGCPDWICGSGS